MVVQLDLYVRTGFVHYDRLRRLTLTSKTLQLHRLGNRLGSLGKNWAMSAIKGRLNVLRHEDTTTVTYYVVTLPTPHAADLLRLDGGRSTRKHNARKSKATPRSKTKDFVLL